MQERQKKPAEPRHDSGEYQSKTLRDHFADRRRLSLLFSTVNWKTGWYFWLLTTLPAMVLNLLLTALVRDENTELFMNIIVLVFSLVLIQIFGSKFARDKYNVKVLPSFCWSVYWRAVMLLFSYIVIISFIAVLLFSVGMEEFLALLVFPIGITQETAAIIIAFILIYISLILLQVSVFGIVVPRALEISYQKIYMRKTVLEELDEDDASDDIDLNEVGAVPTDKWDS